VRRNFPQAFAIGFMQTPLALDHTPGPWVVLTIGRINHANGRAGKKARCRTMLQASDSSSGCVAISINLELDVNM
jgi:hypothetical protein